MDLFSRPRLCSTDFAGGGPSANRSRPIEAGAGSAALVDFGSTCGRPARNQRRHRGGHGHQQPDESPAGSQTMSGQRPMDGGQAPLVPGKTDLLHATGGGPGPAASHGQPGSIGVEMPTPCSRTGRQALCHRRMGVEAAPWHPNCDWNQMTPPTGRSRSGRPSTAGPGSRDVRKAGSLPHDPDGR